MRTFQVPAGQAEGVLAALAREWATERRRQPARRITWFDTFDWRLHQAGWRLWSEQVGRGKPQLCLQGPEQQESGTDPIRTQRWTEGEPPDFVPAVLDPVVGVRRPLPLATVRLEGEVVRLLDARAKTVVRLYLEQGSDLPTLLRVEPLKGYEAVGTAVEERLRELSLEPNPGGFFPLALRAIGREAGDYSSALNIHLEPAMRADSALRRILEHLLIAVERNEEGTRRDLDSEFLHDFRVAVRRTRSVLSQVKGVLPQAQVEPLRQELKWLGQRTGPTRDLDVYLLNMETYKEALPVAVQRDLESLESFLRRHQRIEQRRLARSLDSQRYHRLLESWRRVVAGGRPGQGTTAADEEPPDASRPVREVAVERITGALDRVLKKGGEIQPATPARALHRLRIDCKKLRYLLEIFAGAFAPERIEPPVQALKKLQKTLGNFNDFEVQQETLRDFAHRMMRENPSAELERKIDTLLAMGRLLGHLATGQARERRRFHRRFEKFAGSRVQHHFEAMLAPEPAVGGEA